MSAAITVLALSAGAAIGAPLRYLVDLFVTERAAAPGAARQFPWGLLVVNVLGSAAAGIVLATATGGLRVLLLSGFCGAFTTFSGYAWETDRLWATARSAFWSAVVIMPVACVAAFAVAWRTAALVAS
jgi:fluoride exporter